jgi:hypothetical protein
MCSVRGANGGRDREEGPINAATSAAKLQRARPFKRVCLASHCSLMTPLLQARKTLRKGGRTRSAVLAGTPILERIERWLRAIKGLKGVSLLR